MSSWRQKRGAGGSGKGESTPPPERSPAPPPPPRSAEPAAVPGKSSWRKSGADKAQSGTKRGWKTGPDQSHGQNVARRRLRNTVWGLLLVGLVGLLVYFILLSPKTLPVFALTVTNYEDPQIPHNLTARIDLKHLQDVDAQNDNISVHPATPDGRLDREKLRLFFTEDLKRSRLQPGGPAENTVVMYVNAHGVLDEKNEPCLLLSDAKSLDSTTWYPVRQLLKEIRDRITNGAEIARRQEGNIRTLLVLDCAHARENWSLGVFCNGFFERLRAVHRDIEDPNIVILCSTGAGQRAWTAPELSGSAFGYHFIRALDGAANRNGDNKITLDELSESLAANLGSWVRTQRAEAQTPELIVSEQFGSADAIPIVFAKKSTPPSADSASDWQSKGPDLAKLWNDHEKQQALKPWRGDPANWAALQYRLLRLEEMLLDGTASEREFDPLLSEATNLLSQLGDRPSTRGSPGSFPLAQRFDYLSSPLADQGKLDRLLKFWSSKGKPVLSDPEKDPPLPTDKLAASFAVWSWLVDESRTTTSQEQLTAAVTLLGRPRQAQAGASPATPPVEMAFVRFLNTFLDFSAEDTKSGAVRAIRTRDAVEKLAAPEDERVFPWIAQSLESIDVRRREAEDRLFVGSKEALTEANQRWLELWGADGQSGLLGNLKSLSETVSAALDVQDRVCERLPELAQWVLERHRLPAHVERVSVSLDDLLKLAQSVQRLGTRLDEIPRLDELQAAQADLQAAQLETTALLERLEADFRKHCNYLRTEAAADAETVREIRAVLCCCLATGNVRNELRQKFLKTVAASGHPESGAKAAGGEQSDSAQGQLDLKRDDRFLKDLCTLRAHPALAILDRSKFRFPDQVQPRKALSLNAGDASNAEVRQDCIKHLAALGGDLRRQLKELDSELPRLAKKTPVPLDHRPAGEIAELRRGLSESARLSRMAAPLLGAAAPRGDKDQSSDQSRQPIQQLRTYDRVLTLFSHAQRALDDFWGQVPEDPDTEWYCVRSSDELINSAVSLSTRQWGTARIPEDLATLKKLRGTAKVGLEIPVKPLLFEPDAKSSRQQVSITPEGGLPACTAAFFFEKADGAPQIIPVSPVTSDSQEAVLENLVRRQSVSLAEQSKVPSPPKYDVPLKELALTVPGATVPCKVRLLYRGHEQPAAFLSVLRKPLLFFDVEAPKPRVTPPPTVSVLGSATPTITELLLIFDASGSMSEKIRTTEGTEARIDVARKAVNSIISRLDANDYRVGLMLYGHRARWKSPDSDEVIRFGNAPPDLHPAADVEAVVEMAKNDAAHRVAIVSSLEPLEPRGETPLYFALTEALAKFGRRATGDSRNRRIVVITDGVNQQTRTKTSKAPDNVYKDSLDVIRMLRQADFRDIQIDIVGIAMPERTVPPTPGVTEANLQAVEYLKTIAKTSSGDFFPANDQSQLLDALAKSVLKPEFSVDVPPSQPNNETVPLGRALAVNDFEGRVTTRAVIVHPVSRSTDKSRKLLASKDVVLEGGEALELIFKDPGRLEFISYVEKESARSLRKQETVTHPQQQSEKYVIGLHLPPRQETVGEQLFRLSIQNADPTVFTPRPAAVWAEIRPKLANNSKLAGTQAYFFWDRNFEEDVPVPVLKCQAPKWPEAAKEAEVRLWFRFDNVVPNWEASLDEAIAQRGLALPEFPKTKFTTELKLATSEKPMQIIIREEGLGFMERGPACVVLNPPADRVIRRFYYEAGRAIEHIFEIDKPEPDTTQRRTVRIQSADRIKDGAISMLPLDVTVSRAN